jgi:hypothetical protein
MSSSPQNRDREQARQEAAEFGIDLAQLDANLAMTPAERLAANDAFMRLAERARSQTLSPEQRERLARAEMLEELHAYGFEDVIALYEAMEPP